MIKSIVTEHNELYLKDSENKLSSTDWDTLVNEETILTAIATSFSDDGLTLKCNNKIIEIPTTEISERLRADANHKIDGICCVGAPTAFVLKKNNNEYYGSRVRVHELVKEYLDNLEEGTVLKGRVTHITNYGAFIDIGFGYTGLMLIKDISVSRLTSPADMLTIDSELSVVLHKAGGRFNVSLKELLPTWEESTETFKEGSTLIGVIRYKAEFGTYVALDSNFFGLTDKDSDAYVVGNACSVTIKTISPSNSKVKLIMNNANLGKAEVKPIHYGKNVNKPVIKDWVYNKSDERRKSS